MRKFYAIFSVLIIPAALVMYSWSPGGSPGGKTGSPGDNGATCTECHGGTATPQEDWITTNIPDEGFTPGETYTITATGTYEGVSKFGFELTVEGNGGTKLGGFTITDTERTRFTNDDNAVTHTVAGNMPSGDMNSWSVDWTAPEGDIGSASFYAAFNASEGGGVFNIFTSNLSVTQSAAGVADDALAAKVQVYPNPATRFVNVQLPEGADLRVVDLSGRVLMVTENTGSMEQLDVSGLRQGIYFLSIQHEGAATAVRLLKN